MIETVLAFLRTPITYRIVPPTMGAVGELQIEGQTYNIDRLYVLRDEYNPLFELNLQGIERRVSSGRVSQFVETYIPARAIADTSAATGQAVFAILRDAAFVRELNESIVATNKNVESLLGKLSDYQVDQDPVLRETLRQMDREVAASKAQAATERRELKVRNAEITARTVAIDRVALLQAHMIRRQARLSATPEQRQFLEAQADQLESSAQEQKGALRDAEGEKSRAADDKLAWDEARRLTKQIEARNNAWQRWWSNERGYSPAEVKPSPTKPTYVQVRSFDVPVYVVPPQYSATLVPRHVACFVAGTLIHTQTGSKPIEQIQVGDVVLSQDVRSGALDYRAVMAVHHRPPAATLRISTGDEGIVATKIHRFWVAGKGWVMARDLKVGDPLRTMRGIVAVQSISEDKTQPVYNLDVDTDQDYFVGAAGVLVHDDSVPDPVATPFDSTAELAVANVH